jgi:phage tail tape-measure protein
MSDEKHLPSTADHLAQAAGALVGVVAGAAIGTTAGPVGVLLGGIAGAIGGWWSGRALAERRKPR